MDKQNVIKFPKLTNRQKARYDLFLRSEGKNAAKRYLFTFIGVESRQAIPAWDGREPSSGQTIELDSKITCRSEGSIFRILKNRRDSTFRHFSDHKPFGIETDWVGIEIECLIPIGDFEVSTKECSSCDGTGTRHCDCDSCGHSSSDECSDCDGSGEGEVDYSDTYHQLARYIDAHAKIPYLTIKDDGSLRPGSDHFPVEFTLLVRASNLKPLEDLCKILDDLGAEVNKSCGLHVHLDSRHNKQAEVELQGRNFVKAFGLLQSLVPSTRRDNTYCKTPINKVDSNDRYAAINLSAFKRHKTIEIRLHTGTTNFMKIKNWVTLLQKIKNTQFGGKINNVQDAIQKLNISEDLAEYLAQRAALFNRETSNMVAEGSEIVTDAA